jgi:hypothetical protein
MVWNYLGKMWKKSVLESKKALHNNNCTGKNNHEPIQRKWPANWNSRLVFGIGANVLTAERRITQRSRTLELLSVGYFVQCEDIHGPWFI